MALRPSVSVITTCKGRLHHLKESLPSFLHQNYYGEIEVVVVDYGCPDGTEAWLVDQPVRCVKVLRNTDNFNMSRARNIGARWANNEVLCFVDAHSVLDYVYISHVVRSLQHGTDIVRPATIPGAMSMAKELYMKLRGCDEAFVNYGWDDCDLYLRAQKQGYAINEIPRHLVHKVLHHTDEDKVRFFPNKDLHGGIKLNQEQSKDLDRPINPNGFGVR